jgi:hypothetical protein
MKFQISVRSAKVGFPMGFPLHWDFRLYDFANPDAMFPTLRPQNPEIVNKV